MIAAKLVQTRADDLGELLVGPRDALMSCHSPDSPPGALAVDQDHTEVQSHQQGRQCRADVAGAHHVHHMRGSARQDLRPLGPRAAGRPTARGGARVALGQPSGSAEPAPPFTTRQPSGSIDHVTGIPAVSASTTAETPARSPPLRGARATTCDPPQIIPEASGAPCRCSIGTRCAVNDPARRSAATRSTRAASADPAADRPREWPVAPDGHHGAPSPG